MIFGNLNSDVILQILAYLEKKDLFIFSLVDKNCYKLANSDEVWEKIACYIGIQIPNGTLNNRSFIEREIQDIRIDANSFQDKYQRLFNEAMGINDEISFDNTKQLLRQIQDLGIEHTSRGLIDFFGTDDTSEFIQNFNIFVWIQISKFVSNSYSDIREHLTIDDIRYLPFNISSMEQLKKNDPKEIEDKFDSWLEDNKKELLLSYNSGNILHITFEIANFLAKQLAVKKANEIAIKADKDPLFRDVHASIYRVASESYYIFPHKHPLGDSIVNFLEKILKIVPEDQIGSYIRQKNSNGENVLALSLGIKKLEEMVLKALPEDQRRDCVLECHKLFKSRDLVFFKRDYDVEKDRSFEAERSLETILNVLYPDNFAKAAFLKELIDSDPTREMLTTIRRSLAEILSGKSGENVPDRNEIQMLLSTFLRVTRYKNLRTARIKYITYQWLDKALVYKHKDQSYRLINNVERLFKSLPKDTQRKYLLEYQSDKSQSLLHLININEIGTVTEIFLQSLDIVEDRIEALMRKDCDGNTFFLSYLSSHLFSYDLLNNFNSIFFLMQLFDREKCLFDILKEKNNQGQFPMNVILNTESFNIVSRVLQLLKNQDRAQIIDLFLMTYPTKKKKVLFEKINGKLKNMIETSLEEIHPGIIEEIENKIIVRKRSSSQANLKPHTFSSNYTKKRL